MKKTKIFFALLIATWAIVLSCTKDVDIEGINQSQPVENTILLNKVRLSFDNQKSNDLAINRLNISPSWTKALVFDHSMEVPYTEKGLLQTPSMVNDNKHYGRSRLLFIEKDGISKAMVIQYFPSVKFTGKMSEINTNNLMQKHFDGMVIVKGLGNTSGKAFSFENGKLINQKKVTISPADKNSRKMGMSCSAIYVYEQWFDNSCECWIIRITNTISVCVNDGPDGGGGGGGNEDPNNDKCLADPGSCIDPCTAFPESCGSGGSVSWETYESYYNNSEYRAFLESLNDAEKAFLRANPGLIVIIRNNSTIAANRANILYEGVNFYTNGNAFKHAYFSALNTWYINTTKAREFGNAHEAGQTGNQTQMDLHNNEIGYSIGASNSQYSALEQQAILNVTNGTCRRLLNHIDPNSQIIPTDGTQRK